MRRRVENCLHRLFQMPGFDLHALSLKQVRRQVETELGVKLDPADRDWFFSTVQAKVRAATEALNDAAGSDGKGRSAGASASARAEESYSIDERLSMLIGYVPAPPAMGPRPVPAVLGADAGDAKEKLERGASVSSEYNNEEWARMSLQERSVAEKSRGDALLQAKKSHHAAVAYMQSQLLLMEHVGAILRQNSNDSGGETLVETEAQAILVNVAKLLKFVARLFTNNELLREASAAHACCAVAQMMFVRARMDHYDLLRKDVSSGKGTDKDTSDMMQGVNSMFDAMRSYESAVKCNPVDTPLPNWAVVSADEACRVVREKFLNA